MRIIIIILFYLIDFIKIFFKYILPFSIILLINLICYTFGADWEIWLYTVKFLKYITNDAIYYSESQAFALLYGNAFLFNFLICKFYLKEDLFYFNFKIFYYDNYWDAGVSDFIFISVCIFSSFIFLIFLFNYDLFWFLDLIDFDDYNPNDYPG